MSKSLLEKISSHESLFKAWENLDKHNKSSHGLSGETIEDFEKNINVKIASISKSLKKNKYSFSKNRAVLIPKSDNKFRPLQIPEVSDRLVQKSIAMELEQIFNNIIEKSKGFSFAYQQKIGIKDAIFKIIDHYNNGYKFYLKADIINFFGNVNKEDLLNNHIFPNIPDKSINNLILNAINQDLGGLDKFDDEKKLYFNNIEKGIPQGNPLSPLFSNIYLSPFDTYLIQRDYKLIRYADDFVILCKNLNECKLAYNDCCQILKTLNLKIYSIEDVKKTKINNIDTESLTFLSVTFDGNDIYPSSENFKRIKSKIRDICNGSIDYNVLSLLRKIANVQDGWISAFIYTNLSKYSDELDHFINRQLYLSLIKYEWKFSNKTLGKIPKKYSHRNESRDCLSSKQRLFSGIPLTQDIVKNKYINPPPKTSLTTDENDADLAL